MKEFKSILKTALKQKAVIINLVSGNPPEIVTKSGPIKLNNFSSVDGPTIEKLFVALFPEHQKTLSHSKPVKSTLKIVNFGMIDMIGIPGSSPAIHLYVPPDGKSLFAKAWKILNSSQTEVKENPFKISGGTEVSTALIPEQGEHVEVPPPDLAVSAQFNGASPAEAVQKPIELSPYGNQGAKESPSLPHPDLAATAPMDPQLSATAPMDPQLSATAPMDPIMEPAPSPPPIDGLTTCV